jgi:MFS family permease
MLSFNNYHHHSHHFANKEILEMFSFQVFKELAFGLVNIFVPIYLYTQGVPLFYIMLAFTARTAIHTIVSLFWGRVVLFRLGIKHTFVLTTVLYIVSFILIAQGTSFTWVALWVLFAGIANAFYAGAHHSYLTLTLDTRKAGKEVAMLYILTIIVGIITPFVGAIFIIIFGFQSMLFVGSALLLVSVIPLFYSPEINVSNQVMTPGFSYVPTFWREKKNIAWSVVGNGLDASHDPLWQPLYMYKLLGGLKLLGALTSVIAFLQIFSHYMGGRRSDENKSDFEIGIKGSIFARMFLFASFHPYIAIFSETANSIIHPLFSMPFRAAFYRGLKGVHTISYVVAHEVVWHISNTIAMIILCISVYFIGWYAFLVAGALMIIGKLIIRSQRVGARIMIEEKQASAAV